MEKIEPIEIGNLCKSGVKGYNEMNVRIYDADGASPTIRANSGGHNEIKVAIKQATKCGYIECEIGGVIDMSYPNSKTRRGRVQEGGSVSPTITAQSNGLCRVECVGNVNPSGNGMNGNVFDAQGLSPTLTTNKGEGIKIKEPRIGAIRGRNPGNPSDRTAGIPTQQMLEVGGNVSNALTTVQKDNVVLEPHFRIRKLTPKENWRLMGFDDESFERAAKVNSNSQLYKQAGNSIVVDVLMAIFKEMLGE